MKARFYLTTLAAFALGVAVGASAGRPPARGERPPTRLAVRMPGGVGTTESVLRVRRVVRDGLAADVGPADSGVPPWVVTEYDGDLARVAYYATPVTP